MRYSSRSRQTKSRLSLTALSLANKVCSTCVFWAGARDLRPDGQIEIHPYSKGECRGDGFKNLATAALAACHKWEPWLHLAEMNEIKLAG